jgi:hypothetical protein
MLTQSGADVKVDVALVNGNRFVETGAGGKQLFLFNDSLSNSTITNITVTLNGTDVTSTFPSLTAVTNSPPIMADGTGQFTAAIGCLNFSDCNGGTTPTINDLHFTVTNATLAQLEIGNGPGGLTGNMFVADILCGATQPQCANPLTGPVDVSVPGPVVGAGLPGLLMACAGLVGLARRRRQKIA